LDVYWLESFPAQAGFVLAQLAAVLAIIQFSEGRAASRSIRASTRSRYPAHPDSRKLVLGRAVIKPVPHRVHYSDAGLCPPQGPDLGIGFSPSPRQETAGKWREQQRCAAGGLGSLGERLVLRIEGAWPVCMAALPRPDGTDALVTTNEGAMVELWDPAAGKRIGDPMYGHAATSDPVAVLLPLVLPGEDGPILITGGNDGTLRRWDLAQETSGGSSGE
jgi:WD40 repeat protein